MDEEAYSKHGLPKLVIRNFGSHPRPLNQNLHFNKRLRGFTCRLSFGKHRREGPGGLCRPEHVRKCCCSLSSLWRLIRRQVLLFVLGFCRFSEVLPHLSGWVLTALKARTSISWPLRTIAPQILGANHLLLRHCCCS